MIPTTCRGSGRSLKPPAMTLARVPSAAGQSPNVIPQTRYNPVVQFDQGAGDLKPESQDHSPGSAAPSPDLIKLQLDKILSSETLGHSPQLCRFLQFITEQEIAGQADQLKEYVLGLQVLSKDESFDPRVDTAVRTEARRLDRNWRNTTRTKAVTIRL